MFFVFNFILVVGVDFMSWDILIYVCGENYVEVGIVNGDVIVLMFIYEGVKGFNVKNVLIVFCY